MGKYKLTFVEKVEYRHEVIIETEHEIDGLCDFLEDEIEGSSGLVDLVIRLKNEKHIASMMKVISSEEDEDGCGGEWEIEEYEVSQ